MFKVIVLAVCLLLQVICAIFLINLPSLHLEQGLPLFPAIMAAEAALLGVGICGYAIYSFVLKDLFEAARKRKIPADQPWLANPAWAKGKVVYSAKSAALLLWFFALNWWGAIWFFYDDRADEIIAEGVAIWLLCGFFVLLGVITVWVAINQTVRWLRFGRSVLMIETLPGRPGKPFKAQLRTPFKTWPDKSFRMVLTGFERHWTQRPGTIGEGRRTRQDVQDQPAFLELKHKIAPSKVQLHNGRINVPVSFDLPAKAPSSGKQSDTSEVVWQLRIWEAVRGAPKYEVVFDIPVFEG